LKPETIKSSLLINTNYFGRQPVTRYKQ